MKTLVSLIALLMVQVPLAGVQEDSAFSGNAQLISSAIEEHMGVEPMVSIDDGEEGLVLFVSMGGQWSGSDDDWSDLVVICSAALSVEIGDSRELDDIAVSFGNAWCRIHVEDLVHLGFLDIPEETYLQEMSEMVDVYPLGETD
jgi:hypothetical protein